MNSLSPGSLDKQFTKWITSHIIVKLVHLMKSLCDSQRNLVFFKNELFSENILEFEQNQFITTVIC